MVALTEGGARLHWERTNPSRRRILLGQLVAMCAAFGGGAAGVVVDNAVAGPPALYYGLLALVFVVALTGVVSGHCVQRGSPRLGFLCSAQGLTEARLPWPRQLVRWAEVERVTATDVGVELRTKQQTLVLAWGLADWPTLVERVWAAQGMACARRETTPPPATGCVQWRSRRFSLGVACLAALLVWAGHQWRAHGVWVPLAACVLCLGGVAVRERVVRGPRWLRRGALLGITVTQNGLLVRWLADITWLPWSDCVALWQGSDLAVLQTARGDVPLPAALRDRAEPLRSLLSVLANSTPTGRLDRLVAACGLAVNGRVG
jgi:hypothetical protein